LSSQHLKSSLKRLDHVSEVRRTFVLAAEVRLKEAHRQVFLLEGDAEQARLRLRSAMADIASIERSTGDQLQNQERFIRCLRSREDEIRLRLEGARISLEARMAEWTEAMREQRIVELVQQRRLKDWKRHDDAGKQKAADESAVSHYLRLKNLTNPGSE
jgi:flagellar export protein FliJ